MLSDARILVIDHEPDVWEDIANNLESNGAEVILTESSAEGLRLLNDGGVNIVIIDTGTPNSDHLEVIKQVKQRCALPVIIVSNSGDSMEAVINLEVGADDFISRPFEMRELVARIKANLRLVEQAQEDVLQSTPPKAQHGTDDHNLIAFGDWRLDRDAMKVFDKNNNALDLTTGEYRLLEALVLSAGVVLTREKLFEMTRDEEFDGFDRAVDVQIARIRKKMDDNADAPHYIKTVRGVGYIMDTETRKISA